MIKESLQDVNSITIEECSELIQALSKLNRWISGDVTLRASKEETMKRAIKRSKLDRETNIELVETMWKQFSNLGIYELNVIDTTTHSIKDTVSAVKEKLIIRVNNFTLIHII